MYSWPLPDCFEISAVGPCSTILPFVRTQTAVGDANRTMPRSFCVMKQHRMFVGGLTNRRAGSRICGLDGHGPSAVVGSSAIKSSGWLGADMAIIHARWR